MTIHMNETADLPFSATCDNCESELMSIDGEFYFQAKEEVPVAAEAAGWSVGTIAVGRLYCPDCAARHHNVDWS